MKLLAIDLDGTTLTKKEVISKKTMQALQEAYEQGVVIVPCTGRCLDCFPRQLQQAPFFSYAISSNGARVTHFKTRENLYKQDMPNVDIVSFLESAPSIGVTCHVNHEYKIQGRILSFFAQKVRGKDALKMETVKSLYSYLKRTKKDVECMQIFMNGRKTYHTLLSILEKFDGITHTSTNAPKTMYMELYASNTSKGIALQFLIDYLGIEKEDVYCIGDGDNDISMFDVASYSIAVENASKDLKKKADVIVPSNNKDGVAYAIEKYVLKS